MHSEPTTVRRPRIVALVQSIFPNLPVALVALGGLVIEGVMLAQAPGHVYTAGGPTPLFAVLFLAWFWLTFGWLVWIAARMCESVRRRFGRLAGVAFKSLVTVASVVVILEHLASWGMYLRTGRFVNLEGLMFLIKNPPQTTWLYLGPGERVAIVTLGIVGLVLLALIPLLLTWVARARWKGDLLGTQSGTQHSSWRWATILMLAMGTWIAYDMSPQRRATRMDTLKHCVSPTVALAASSFDTLLGEPIEACIDTSELTPIASTAWNLPTGDTQRRPSIIIIAIESLRHDVVNLRHQGREVTPNLNRLAKNGLQWTRSYAQSTHSDYADVCLVSSLYPLRTRHHHYYRKSDPWPRTLIYDALKPAGYATAIISSQNESWGCMDQFLETPNLDLFYDAKRSGAETYISERDPGFAHEIRMGTFKAGCLYDSHTMDTAIDWVTDQVHEDQPFFLSMNFQASHFPYELEPGSERPFQPCNLDSDITFMNYPVEKVANVRNAYYNAIHHCDRQLGRMVEALRKLGQLDDTILVVMGENGEAFHENGSVGHAREPVEPAVHVATVMHAPNLLEPGVEEYPFEHVDLVPTLFGLVGWPSHPNFQGIDARSSARPPLEERLIFFHVLSPAAQADAVMLAGRWKYMVAYNTGRTWLFDLQNDPEESTNVADEHPELAARLREVLATWRARQLAYYHFPLYYQSYYPPRPPQLGDAVNQQWAGLTSPNQAAGVSAPEQSL